MATNEGKVAQLHDVGTWEPLAEVVAECLTKGSRITAEGRLQTRSWEAADGSKRRAIEIVAPQVSRRESQEAGSGRRQRGRPYPTGQS